MIYLELRATQKKIAHVKLSVSLHLKYPHENHLFTIEAGEVKLSLIQT
jgi:hypothetical protein